MADHGSPVGRTDPDLQRQIVDTARRFVTREVVPVAAELERTDEFPVDLVAQMSDLGFFGITIPRPTAASASTCRPTRR